MFENEFNCLFNLHKAYTDIGVDDNDAEVMGKIYGLTKEEVEHVFGEFEKQNKENARLILEEYGKKSIGEDRKFKIAYLGDSITSYRMSHRCIMKEIYAGQNNITWKDFSISGYKVSDLFTAYYPSIANFAPDIAIIMIGTNDMRITQDEYDYVHTPIEHFKRDYSYLLNKLSKAGCKVIALTLPPFCMDKMSVALSGWNILYKEDILKEYDTAILQIAKKEGAVVINMQEVYNKYTSDELTIIDGLHLNPFGQKLLAGKIYEKLSELLL